MQTSAAVETLALLIIGILCVVTLMLGNRSTLLTADHFLYSRFGDLEQATTGQSENLTDTDAPCYSGFQCRTGMCISKEYADKSVVFSFGRCSGNASPSGCFARISFGVVASDSCGRK